MAVYFIAAGRSSNNRGKTLDRAHRVEDLTPHVPPHVAERLREAFPSGEGVYAWGGSDPRHRVVLGLAPGTYVVDIANADVKQVFQFAFGYRASDFFGPGDHRIQDHFDWDDHVDPEARRPYPLVYFLRAPRLTSRSDSAFFRDAFGRSANWLPGQELLSDEAVAEAMARVGAVTVEEFLGIEPPRLEPPSRSDPVREPLTPPYSSGAAALDSDPRGTQTGQGRGLTAPERRAVELHAMAIARAHFGSWDIRDVSGSESYDLLCLRGAEELRVEVKGTTGDGGSVLLTRNEVDHARDRYPHVALVVVSGIDLAGRGTGAPTASGGALRVFLPWDVDAAGGQLRAETYKLTLPPA